MTTKNQNFKKEEIPKKVNDCDVTHQIVLNPGQSNQIQNITSGVGGDEILFKYVGPDHDNGFTINFENTVGAPPDEVIPAGTNEWTFADPGNDWPGEWYYSIEVNDCNTLALDPVIIIDPSFTFYNFVPTPWVSFGAGVVVALVLRYILMKIQG